eukprot:scaffold9746_cov28-Tisochrysis_lutea.AAC.1
MGCQSCHSSSGASCMLRRQTLPALGFVVGPTWPSPRKARSPYCAVAPSSDPRVAPDGALVALAAMAIPLQTTVPALLSLPPGAAFEQAHSATTSSLPAAHPAGGLQLICSLEEHEVSQQNVATAPSCPVAFASRGERRPPSRDLALEAEHCHSVVRPSWPAAPTPNLAFSVRHSAGTERARAGPALCVAHLYPSVAPAAPRPRAEPRAPAKAPLEQARNPLSATAMSLGHPWKAAAVNARRPRARLV